MPGVIPRANFIDRASIEGKLQGLRGPLEFFAQLAARRLEKAAFQRELRDAMLGADEPAPIAKCALEFLGHTNAEFVTRQDDLDLENLTEEIKTGEKGRAE